MAVDPKLQEEINKAFKRLKKYESNKESIKQSDFKKFEILFRKPKKNMTDSDVDMLQELSREFLTTINPFKPIKIIDDDTGKIILTLPPIFMNIKEIKKEFNNVFQKAQGALLNSTTPKYESEAIKNIVNLIVSSQAKNISEYEAEVRKYKLLTDKLRNEFKELKQKKIDGEDTEIDFNDVDDKLGINELNEENNDTANESYDDIFNSLREE